MTTENREFLQLIHAELLGQRDHLVAVREEQSAHGQRLSAIETRQEEQRRDIAEIRRCQVAEQVSLAKVKTRYGLWGGAAILVTAVLSVLVSLLGG
jgi:hypothetical protein